jgi:hypothetical protein
MQISHAGRQSPRYATRQPVGPSAVTLDLLGSYKTPRALEEHEILDIIQRFGAVAKIAQDCGFTGVQVHGAHGYLISSFLSPVTNRREDRWGGSTENRARLLIECVRAVRAQVGPGFPVSVKLNSDDFRKGGFSHADCLQVVELLNAAGIDLLEISGGTYEQPRLLGVEGRSEDAVQVRSSTRVREAYFLEYAEAIRRVATMPLMVTGGFRTREGMEARLGRAGRARHRAAFLHAPGLRARTAAPPHRPPAGLRAEAASGAARLGLAGQPAPADEDDQRAWRAGLVLPADGSHRPRQAGGHRARHAAQLPALLVGRSGAGAWCATRAPYDAARAGRLANACIKASRAFVG